MICKRQILITFLFFILLLACDNNLRIPENELLRPIKFTQTQSHTKGLSEGQGSLAPGLTVGMIAYYLQSNEDKDVIWNNDAIPNFMYNQYMKSLEYGELAYSPIKYWPNNEYDRIKFFAYSPHSAEANGNTIALSSVTTTGLPTLDYSPSTEVSNQADLLIAVTGLLNSGGVKLNFKHALTQLSFSAQCINNLLNQAITITSIKLSNVANGNGQFTDTGFQWTASTTTQDYTLSINQSITGDTSTDLSGSLYLVPQTSTCKLDIELMVGGIRMRTPQRDISTSDWAQGKKINYLLTINLNDLITL